MNARDDLPTFYGAKTVAQWCGVPVHSVTNWLRRFDDYPVPAGRCAGPDRSHYFWREDQREEWLHWAHGKDVTVMTARPEGRPPVDLSENVRALLPYTRAGNRALRALRRAGINTLEDLLYVEGEWLLTLPQFGPACLEVVRAALAERGQVLMDELTESDLA